MIKNIYFYWGNETMSYMRYMTLYSFSKFNPDWKVYIIRNSIVSDRRQQWITPELQDKSAYRGIDYTDRLKNLDLNVIEFTSSMIDMDKEVVDKMSDVHIKDILNWKILGDWGGVVADMDILFIKPLLDAISNDAEIGLVCFNGHPKKDYIPVTFMYSSGENEFFRKVYRRVLNRYNPSVYESCGTLCIEEKNLDEIRKNFPHLTIQRFKDSIVFPFINYEWGRSVEMLYRGDFSHDMCKDSVGIHWYGGTQLSQYYNNIINDSSVYEFNNTISIMIRGLL